MAEGRAPPRAQLPTLTEVVDLSGPGRAAPASAPALAIDREQIVAEVMQSLQQRIDLMFEYRLREALAPLLARMADGVIREARDELAQTLRDVVTRAVNQELSRRRLR